MNGIKLYERKNTWTYDNFGSFDKEKFYAVFAYDDALVRYDPLEKY